MISIEVYALDGDGWRLLGSHAEEAVVRAAPFEDLELALSRLWTP